MTYCVGILLRDGMVLASDSRTNAGVDQVGAYLKMHAFVKTGKRFFTLLSSGNLATTQAVIHRLGRDISDPDAERHLFNVENLPQAADYVGSISRAQQSRYGEGPGSGVNFEASFILAGQIAGQAMGMALIYPQGNHIAPSVYNPYLQIGETKYGKPILDRMVHGDLSLENAARVALVSLDSAIRANLSVGPPIDLLIYQNDQLTSGRHLRMDQDDSFLNAMRAQWNLELTAIFDRLPTFEWEAPRGPDEDPRRPSTSE